MQHSRQGMNVKHLLIMVIVCLVPIVALGAALLLDIPLGTVGTIALLLLCPLGHFLMMRWMGHGHDHSGMGNGQSPVERSAGAGLMATDERHAFETPGLMVDNGRRQQSMGWLSRLLGEDNKGHATEMHGMQPHSQMSSARERKATDPVCGMEVDINMAAAMSVYQGKDYYFCSPGCKNTFDQNPARYSEGGGHGMSGHGCCHRM